MLITGLLITIIVLSLGWWWKSGRSAQQATRRRRHEPRLDKKMDPLENAAGEMPDLGNKKHKNPTPAASDNVPALPKETRPSYIGLHVVCPKNQLYGGYELLQALLSNGLRFGENHIFHRHESKTGRGPVLFSVASLNRPGTFELSKMGEFVCPGLSLFMVIGKLSDPLQVFNIMLETAEQLVEDLGGDIWNDQHQAITPQYVDTIRSSLQNMVMGKRIPDFDTAPNL